MREKAVKSKTSTRLESQSLVEQKQKSSRRSGAAWCEDLSAALQIQPAETRAKKNTDPIKH